MHYMDPNKTAGEEARRQLHKNAASNIEQVLAATPHKTPTVQPPASYHENYSSLTNQTCRTLLEKTQNTYQPTNQPAWTISILMCKQGSSHFKIKWPKNSSITNHMYTHLKCKLNYHHQKIRKQLARDIRKHYVAVSTFLGLISSLSVI